MDVILSATTGGFNKAISGAGSLLTSFAGATVAGIAAVGAAAVAAGGALAALGISQLEPIDQLGKLSDKTGISTEALAGLQHQAALAGASNEDLAGSLKQMAKGISEAAAGGGSAAEAFAQLGINVADLAKLSGDKQLALIADRLNLVGNAADKTRLSMSIFGDAGDKIINTLAGGSEGFAKAREEAERLGLVVSREDAKAVEEANDAWTRFKESLNGIGRTIAVAVAPLLRNLGDFFTDMGVKVRETLVEWGPVFSQAKDVVVAAVGAVREILASLWDTVKPALIKLLQFIGIDLSGGFGSFKDQVINVLRKVEFGFKNWRDVLELVFLRSKLAVVSFVHDVVHFFTETIPSAFVAFAHIAEEVLGNIFNNVANFSSKVFDWVKSGFKDWGFVWTPLSVGFQKEIDKIKTVAKRGMSDLEKELSDAIASKSGALGEKWDKFLGAKELEAKLKNAPRLIINMAKDAADLIGKSTDLTPAALQHGSAEAFTAIRKAKAEGADVPKILLDIAKANKEQEKTLKDIKRNQEKDPLGLAFANL